MILSMTLRHALKRSASWKHAFAS